MHRIAFLAVMCLAASSLGGCQLIVGSARSVSDSAVGSAESIAGAIQAISRSSGSPPAIDASPAYRRDVRTWTAEVVHSGRSQEEFLRGIGRIAESHGLTHWEAQPATLAAIGEGLRDAGWSAEQIDALREALHGIEPRDVDHVIEGYRRASSG
jgi:hypothetical protein